MQIDRPKIHAGKNGLTTKVLYSVKRESGEESGNGETRRHGGTHQVVGERIDREMGCLSRVL
jgi:hypothetical protein